jgi:toxin HigB-1
MRLLTGALAEAPAATLTAMIPIVARIRAVARVVTWGSYGRIAAARHHYRHERDPTGRDVGRNATLNEVRIRTFSHAGLRRLYHDGQSKGLPADAVDKMRKMLAFLQDMGSVEELRSLPAWKAHRLGGDRKGTWALHVTRNWRLTFRIDRDELFEVNYEDYH